MQSRDFPGSINVFAGDFLHFYFNLFALAVDYFDMASCFKLCEIFPITYNQVCFSYFNKNLIPVKH